MIRGAIIFFIFFISSCGVINQKKIISNNNITIYAKTQTGHPLLRGFKTTTKIKILKDSIVLSASPALGLELVKLTITDENIYIEQKLKNKRDTIATKFIDPNFQIKDIKKFITKPKTNQDKTLYQGTNTQALFTNYINKQNIFLPQSVVFWTSPSPGEKKTKFELEIEYKSIKFLSKK
tara:strand:- start:969 stop:1505 length:537 start_codon:yes stop_codon:yes gene_type:complete